MPDDVTRRVNLDDAVVELISDKNIPRMIKSMMMIRFMIRFIFSACDPGTA